MIRSLSVATVLPARRWQTRIAHRCLRLWNSLNCERRLYLEWTTRSVIAVSKHHGHVHGAGDVRIMRLRNLAIQAIADRARHTCSPPINENALRDTVNLRRRDATARVWGTQREPRLQFGRTYLVPTEDGREVPGRLNDTVVDESELFSKSVRRVIISSVIAGSSVRLLGSATKPYR
jgi:hypothetical protein